MRHFLQINCDFCKKYNMRFFLSSLFHAVFINRVLNNNSELCVLNIWKSSVTGIKFDQSVFKKIDFHKIKKKNYVIKYKF